MRSPSLVHKHKELLKTLTFRDTNLQVDDDEEGLIDWGQSTSNNQKNCQVLESLSGVIELKALENF